MQFVTALPERIPPQHSELVYDEEMPITREVNIHGWEVDLEFVDADGRLWRRRGIEQSRRVTERQLLRPQRGAPEHERP